MIRRQDCRLCGGALRLLLDYGQAPLVNVLRAHPDEPIAAAPLSLRQCRACGLVQVPEVLPAARLFSDYPYRTGTSATMRAHLDGLARALAATAPGGRVLELGCNDGTLLDALRAAGMRAVGVDPAHAPAAEARARGHRVLDRPFDDEALAELREEAPFHLVVGTNVLAHVDDPLGLLRRARALLRPGGQLVVEVPDRAATLRAGALDTIYHEHLSLFSADCLWRLGQEAGLALRAVERVAVHGGSLRATFAATRSGLPAPPPPCALPRLEARARALAQRVQAALEPHRSRGEPIMGLGASAKGVMLLHLCGIDDLCFVVDRAPSKQGRYLPIGRVPVRSPDDARAEHPALALLLAWNLREELLAARRPGDPPLVVPLPRLRRVPAPTAGRSS